MSTGVLAALRKACGDEGVREARAADAVHGATPAWVAAPADTGAAADVMRVAAEYGLRVVPQGAGTKLDWGAPPRSVDLVISTTRMTGIVEHAAGDLVAVARAGTSMSSLQLALARHGQRLALDPVGGTVGGTVSVNASGPLRLRHGTARDLLIGITVVRPDGVVAHAGGKVVKNVAGYDLGKLYTGSYGTLGLVTETTFRLDPLPPTKRFVSREVTSPAEAERLVLSVMGSQLAPTALELDWPASAGPGTLTVLLEGTEAGIAARVPAAAETLESVEPDSALDAPGWWGRYPGTRHEVTLKISMPIALLATALHTLHTTATAYGLRPAARGAAGSGVLYVGLGRTGEPTTVAEFVGDLRAALTPHGGQVVVLRAPAAVAASVDVWGPVGALELMRRVKDQFDPEHRCAPGRFVGGI